MADARVVAERFFERFGANDIDGAIALFASDCISVTPTGLLTNAKHHSAARGLKRALPDSFMELLRVIEVGDEVYVTGRFKGTHTGDLVTPAGTLAASDRSLDLFFIDYFRVVGGQIVACEAARDRLDMILQLGANPRL
jgi:ketosteroid isomerase-like protein